MFGRPVKVPGPWTILTGTVRRIGRSLNQSFHLIDPSTHEAIWHRVLTIGPSDLSTPDAISLIAREISSTLDSELPTISMGLDPAYQNKTASEYIRAGHDLEKRRGKLDFEHALQCFQLAIDAEPKSGLARADYAKAAVSYFFAAQGSPELLTKAERLSQEAVELNPELSEAHRALSSVLYAQGDFAGSTEESLQAIELGGLDQGPLQSVAANTKRLGRPDLALRWQKIAEVIQDTPADYEFEMADSWALLGDDSKAERIYRRFASLHPESPEGWLGICELRILQGDFDAARQLYQQRLGGFTGFPATKEMAARVEFFARNWPEAERLCQEVAAANSTGLLDFAVLPVQSVMGRIFQLTDRSAEGESLLERLLAAETRKLERVPGNPELLYRVAAVEASLDREEEAIDHLRRAFEAGRIDYRSLQLDPRFDSLRRDERFGKILLAMAARVASLRATVVNHNK